MPAGVAERPDPVASRQSRYHGSLARAVDGRRGPFRHRANGASGGSDAGNLRLRIERDGEEYIVNGEKTSISAADQADAAVVFGRTGTVESGAHGVTALLIPMDLPGITRGRFDCHGQRAIGRGSLFLRMSGFLSRIASARKTRASCRSCRASISRAR